MDTQKSKKNFNNYDPSFCPFFQLWVGFKVGWRGRERWREKEKKRIRGKEKNRRKKRCLEVVCRRGEGKLQEGNGVWVTFLQFINYLLRLDLLVTFSCKTVSEYRGGGGGARGKERKEKGREGKGREGRRDRGTRPRPWKS